MTCPKKTVETDTKLSKPLKGDGTRSLCDLIKEHMVEHNVSTVVARHMKNELQVSYYVWVIPPPTIGSEVQSDGIVIPSCPQTSRLRVGASNKHYFNEGGRHDSPMVEKVKIFSSKPTGRSTISVWFSKCLLSPKIKLSCSEYSDKIKVGKNSIVSNTNWNETILKEIVLCFVQWYKILDENMFIIDWIDEVLKCLTYGGKQLLEWKVFCSQV